jgi:membrane associated rhomboid family serine protease
MVLPIHDRNPVRRTPIVTYSLIAINLIVFALEPVHHFHLGGYGSSNASLCDQYRFFDKYGAIPHELITGQVQPRDYVNGAGQIVCASDYPDKVPALSVLYAMFLHASWLHVLGNMLFLFVFGNNVEDRLGRIRYLLFYLASGYIATYGFALVFRDSHTVLVGASGAIAGVLGAYLWLWPRARVISLVPFLLFLPLPLPAWLVLGSWFLLQWWYSIGGLSAQGSGVAYLAHVIGVVFGMLLALTLRRGSRGRPPPGWDGARYPRRAVGWPR